MASEGKETRPTAAESLVKATVTVLDKVGVRAQFDRASIETTRRLGGSPITFLA